MGSQNKTKKSFQVLFHNIEVSLYTSFLIRLPLHIIDITIDSLHESVILAWLLIQLDNQIKEKKLKDVLSILREHVLKFLVVFARRRQFALLSKLLANQFHFCV